MPRERVERLPRGTILGELQMGVDHVIVGVVRIERGIARARSAEARFASIEFPPVPSRVKMCDGMCRACGASGAIFAYCFAASTPCFAIAG